MSDRIDLEVLDDILSDDADREDYPDTEVGEVAYRLDRLPCVLNVEVRVDEGKPAVAVRFDPSKGDVRNLVSIAGGRGFDIVDEQWDDERGHMQRLYRKNPPEADPAWLVASEEIADLVADHTPAATLDYWLMERAAEIPAVNGTQRALADHRGVTQQAVSDNIRRVSDE